MSNCASAANGGVAIVVVNWNSWPLTLTCLASVRRSVGADWHMFLVDNASTDGSPQYLAELGDDVTFIKSENNGGWTGGNNLGVRAALDAGYNWVFILNSDAEVLPTTVAMLRDQAASTEPAAILGPVQLDEKLTPDFIGSKIDLQTGMPILLRAHEIDLEEYPSLYPTAYIRGAGLFIARSHFEAVGGFDDDFFLNYDETDWCFRARAAGYKVLMMRAATIIHVGSASIGGAMSPLNIYFNVRNGLLFAERHCRPHQRLRHLIAITRWLASLPQGGSRIRRVRDGLLSSNATAVAARRGFLDYVRRRFGDCPPLIRILKS